MEIKIIKGKTIKTNDFFRKIRAFASKRSHWALVVVSFGLLFYCGYQWYFYIYNPGWDEVKRQEYIGTKDKDAVFNKEKFDKVILITEERKREYQRKLENVPDIFRIK